mmetsp:Transcript_28281/g.45807  ORF Transcript_28281/g.45807 Transcript_28281/m.45807 type:complete len:81 (-) Transcript_28281:2189-2431(-)
MPAPHMTKSSPPQKALTPLSHVAYMPSYILTSPKAPLSFIHIHEFSLQNCCGGKNKKDLSSLTLTHCLDQKDTEDAPYVP